MSTSSTRVKRVRDLLGRGTPSTHPEPQTSEGDCPLEATIPIPDAAKFRYGLRGGRFHDIALTTIGRMNMAGLRPDHDVLDIGCGVGRTAHFLCDYLESGYYEGFDTMSEPVFTHLLPESATNYLQEIGRVLRTGGISYSTWSLFNDEASGNTHVRTTKMEHDESETFAVDDPNVPEDAVGYNEAFVRGAHAAGGLNVLKPVHPGFHRLQDVIVAVK